MEDNRDPSKQQHHTFGWSKAAVRLKAEIDKGAKYRSAVRVLNRGMELSNDLAYGSLWDQRTWLLLLRKEIMHKLDHSNADPIIKSLCKNVFVTKYRWLLKAFKEMDEKEYSL